MLADVPHPRRSALGLTLLCAVPLALATACRKETAVDPATADAPTTPPEPTSLDPAVPDQPLARLRTGVLTPESLAPIT
ncbi:MAG: hypothetical protein IAG13_29980, partial [Deltaproteobacteria bacterium]|nr:hypothetical protein [Nannocystaceae bacterium]